MSTDIAEFLGAALGLNLLFGVPLLPAGFITGAIAFGAPRAARHGFRRFELAITALLGLVLFGFLYETLKIGPSASGPAQGLVPHLDGAQLGLSRGRDHRRHGDAARDLPPLGADEQTHAGARTRRSAARVLRFARIDVIVALGLAGLVNMAMLAVAAKLFHDTPGWSHVDTIQEAHAGFAHLVGGTAALMFAVALLASGISSSSVGTYAGQVVMAGFVNLRISLFARRALTMLPALVDPRRRRQHDAARSSSARSCSRSGSRSRSCRSLLLTRRKDVMGIHVNRRSTTVVAVAIAALISALNVFLLAQAFGIG